MRTSAFIRRVAIVAALALGAMQGVSSAACAQQRSDSSAREVQADSSAEGGGLALTIGNWGVAIGNVRRVTGIRLNYRDRGPFVVDGVNATIWMPYEPALGVVNGIALGVPVTGARSISGLAIGMAGVGADDRIDGLALAPVGIGSGNGLHGIMLAGLGGGTGGDISGIALAGIGMGSGGGLNGVMVGGVGTGTGGDAFGLLVGGVGAGAGGSLRGIAIGGVGAGAGGDVHGLLVGGVGAGAGGSFTGIGIGGVGIGAGGDFDGLALAGLGAGTGGRLRGIVIAGIGAGAGQSLEGIAIAGVGVGAPHLKGLVVSTTAGASEARAVILAPAYFRIVDDGKLSGLSLSAFNHIKGEQHGLTIGIFNYARELHGVQIGILNYAGNNHGALKLLPVLNVHLP